MADEIEFLQALNQVRADVLQLDNPPLQRVLLVILGLINESNQRITEILDADDE